MSSGLLATFWTNPQLRSWSPVIAGSFFRPHNQPIACFAERTEDDEEALNVLEACGRRVLDLRAVHEVDVPRSSTFAMALPGTLTASLWSFGIQLVPFAKGSLLVGISKVQLRMIPLRL